MGKITSLLLSLLLFHTSAKSQGAYGYKPHPFLSPMWQADVEYLAPSQVTDSSMENGFTGAAFTWRIPLYTGKDWLGADGGKPLFAVIGQFNASARQSQIDYIEPDRLLTQGRVGITGLMAPRLRNLYLLNLSLALPTESFRLRARGLRLNGALVWRKLYHNNRWWHTLGLTFTPVWGRDLLLPMAGIGIKLGNDDQLQFTYPFNAAYTHIFTRKMSLTFRIQNMGGYHFMQPDSLHDSDPLLYRFNHPRLGVLARFYTHRHVVLTPEIACAAFNRIEIDEKRSRQDPALYFRMSVQVRFGKRPPAAPILNFDPGDFGFDPTYLVE